MGIPKFYSWYSQSEIFRETIHRQPPTNIQIFAIDVNGLIHTNAQKIFGYGGEINTKTDEQLGVAQSNGSTVYSQERYDELEQELFTAIFNDIVGLTRTVAPSETLIIAVDGPAPLAKISQQRNRRYKSASEPSRSKIFDSNCITPGTDFMFRLDEFIQETLVAVQNWDQKIDTDEVIGQYATGLPVHIIYSGHLTPGEGEHKIADELRKIPTANKKVVVHGADADLFMIYLTQLKNGWENIYLFRNNFKDYTVNSLIDLRRLNSILNNSFGAVPSAADDFVVMLYLIGNDFLPPLAVFSRVPDALQTLYGGYRMWLAQNPQGSLGSLTDGYQIVWKNLAGYLDFISGSYGNILYTRWALNEDGMITTPMPSIVTDSISMFSRVNGPSSVLTRTFNVEAFKSSWYVYLFSPKTSNIKVTVLPQDIDELVSKYLEGIAWVYNYYRYGVSNLNVSWFYPYNYGPLLSDVGAFINRSTATPWIREPIYSHTQFINSLVQLVLVLPPSSIMLVPTKLKQFYSEQSPIMDMLPSHFYYDNKGKMQDYQGHLILPQVQPARIVRLLAALGITEEEYATYGPAQTIDVHRNLLGQLTIQTVQPRVYHGGNRGRGGQRGRGQGGRGQGGRGRGNQGSRGARVSFSPQVQYHPIPSRSSEPEVPLISTTPIISATPLIPLNPLNTLTPLTSSLRGGRDQEGRGGRGGRGGQRGRERSTRGRGKK